jgi:2,3-bisphosphoglycerate-independent phosphoglycerate mutase
VIFYDLRGEREVELSRALIDPGFSHFKVAGPVQLTTMIEYHPDLDVKVAFPPEYRIKNTLSEAVGAAGMRQLKVCESEKAVHLGYFLNGKTIEQFSGEDRVIVESPRTSDYSLVPELMAKQVADELVKRFSDRAIRFFAVNFANVDVVGHLEDESAIIRAVECVDEQVGRVADEALRQGVTTIISADHGTVEKWLYPDGAIDTGHTDSPAPLILVDDELKAKGARLRPGELSDLAPTILDLLGLDPPQEMTGASLIDKGAKKAKQVLLIIADGWGFREERYGNLILKAKTPNFDRLWNDYPHATLKASGPAVGMPEGAVGNSEAGHLHIGAGRRVYSDRVRIDRAIADKTFFQNPVLRDAARNAAAKKVALHLLGIVSFYSSHGSLSHLYALLDLCREQGAREVYLHSLLGRRGERPESGAHYIREVEDYCNKNGLGKVATVMGRFWALDREQNWDRVEKAYAAMVFGQGVSAREEP